MLSNKSRNLLLLFSSLSLEGISLLGLSHISVNASMTVNDTALTSSTISRLEVPDPIDTLDITVCPADDILDGCKVGTFLSPYSIWDLLKGNKCLTLTVTEI